MRRRNLVSQQPWAKQAETRIPSTTVQPGVYPASAQQTFQQHPKRPKRSDYPLTILAQNNPTRLVQSRPVPVPRSHISRMANKENYPPSATALADLVAPLIKYYDYPSSCLDSRRYIRFTHLQLIDILTAVAKAIGERRNLEETQSSPFFGFSEHCFTALLVYALDASFQFNITQWTTGREIQFSHHGKNLIRNLLHTARIPIVPDYVIEPTTKTEYIRTFQNACAKFVDLRQKELGIVSVDREALARRVLQVGAWQ